MLFKFAVKFLFFNKITRQFFYNYQVKSNLFIPTLITV